MLYFVNNICKSYLPNTSKRKFMIELLHDLILYKTTNSTRIDLRDQWEIAHKTLNIIDTINIISSKQFPKNSMLTVTYRPQITVRQMNTFHSIKKDRFAIATERVHHNSFTLIASALVKDTISRPKIF